MLWSRMTLIWNSSRGSSMRDRWNLGSKWWYLLLNGISWKNLFEKNAGSLLDFAHSYNKFGLNINQDGDLEYREWAPNAKEVSLVSKNQVRFTKSSLETSTSGIVIRTSARRMISACGPWSFQRTQMTLHCQLSICHISSAVLPSKMEKESIEYPLGPNTPYRIPRISCSRPHSGTLNTSISGRHREWNSQRVWGYMRHMSAW